VARASILFPVCMAAACGQRATAEQLADRSWHAHSIVIAAGERADTCAAAGTAMQHAFAAHRQDFVDGITLDDDAARRAEATAFMSSDRNRQRYRDLETRMIALADRCADEPTVRAVFETMEQPK
jgi:hypothetical protein